MALFQVHPTGREGEGVGGGGVFRAFDELFCKTSFHWKLSVGWQNLRNLSQLIHPLSCNCSNLTLTVLGDGHIRFVVHNK